MNPTRAIVHLERLENNLAVLRHVVEPRVKICAAVKASAYGHGAIEVATQLKAAGVEALGIANPCEGAELRGAGIQGPLVMFGATSLGQIDQIVSLDLEPFVFDASRIEALARAAHAQKKTLRVHLKIDTGMGRLGARPEEAAGLAWQIVHEPGLELEGLCTHFAASDGPGPITVPEQLRRFEIARQGLAKKGIHPRLVHAANSGAILDWPEAHFDMVRPGIALYGYPEPTQKRPNPGLAPVMEWVTEVAYVKEVAAGTRLSYGSRYITSQRTKIATIPVGYADGWRRSFCNRASLVVGNQLAMVSGTVCMDQFMVDLGPDSTVRVGDRVVLMGQSDNVPVGGPRALSAQELAALDGTISYEFLCGIGPRVEREYR